MFNLFPSNNTQSHKLGLRTLSSKRYNFEEANTSEPNDVEHQPPMWEILNKQQEEPFEKFNPAYKLTNEEQIEKSCDIKQQFVKPNIQKKVSSKKFSLKQLVEYKVVKDKIEAVPK
jgi:hypothetical protein